MFRIALVDQEQAVVSEERFQFQRVSPSGSTITDRANVTRAASANPPPDLIVIGNGGGYGFSLVTAVPWNLRSRVVVMSGRTLSPELTEDYGRLGVTAFSGRENDFAAFLTAWADRQSSTQPSTDAGTP